MTYTLYGIIACDTMKKAQTWLTEHGHTFDFHDYKKSGIDQASLERWCNEHGWETILNTRGTTYRKLDEADKQDLNQEKAIALLLQHTSMIKRPVLDLGERTLVGFKADDYAAALSQ